ncbi:unnamed protein product [Rotaria sp. Silwood2]|nr:unnamed protein product [Rotaria sp. Silwood2]CAF2614809.1 unnamed protein product [Rotaria sp. Silwood2]CAF3007701.1 unnamed protein product [Rotaria sp. Silwood2]CAF4015956.1 unnamed protein product [Rotaria sp. Silwood2]CAF4314870.1 unnamed protein product [Rotaria sp. Silwood2]
MIPSTVFCQQQQQQQQQNHNKNEISSSSSSLSSSNDDGRRVDESNNNSFYHNPYHSSGQMNYIDVPQQQYTNEHTYPTYLAQQQISDITNQSVDDQIHAKLLSLQQRGNQFQPHLHRSFHYTYRKRTLSTSNSLLIPNTDRERSNTDEEQLEKAEEEKEEKEDNDDGSDDDDGNNCSIPTYYSGQYSNFDEHFDFASVVLWYRNVMRSVKKIM